MGSHSGGPAPDEERLPIADVLRGLSIHGLDEGGTAIEAFVLLKILDHTGRTGWSYRTTNALNREEFLGALTRSGRGSKKELRDEWDDADD